eukprot:CAMPEP_0170499356 /NCGR_PEP_ID=MMETSP0208-20121228/31117_1 /TAXON_ID=197538 /ORGANISM="Strombidium inclinatum, Strain S3" /LENGTH=92 /DNA_ID=CAMNT_0010776871 /DNA_START=396 /DNA_END=674 /DNA_ORIENTATION=-
MQQQSFLTSNPQFRDMSAENMSRLQECISLHEKKPGDVGSYKSMATSGLLNDRVQVARINIGVLHFILDKSNGLEAETVMGATLSNELIQEA